MVFQPGQSGNPGGRPKDVLGPALLKALGPEEWAELVIQQCRKGNVKALDLYADRVLGKPIQQVTLSGDQEMPLHVRLVTGGERSFQGRTGEESAPTSPQSL